MVSRVGPLFRPEKLAYPELGALETAIEELLREGLLRRNPAPDLSEIFRLCRKDEVVEIFCGRLENVAGARKGALLEQLQDQGLTGADCAGLWGSWYAEQLVQPLDLEVVELLLLLFYGNLHQDLTDFVLSDLGVARYYNYPLDRSFRLFQQRSQVDEYLLLGELRSAFYEAVDADAREQVRALVQHLGERDCTPALQQRWDRLRNRVARQLERYQELDLALHLYSDSALHPARERRVRILQNQGRPEAALELCLEMRECGWCEEELDFLQRQIPLLQKKLGLDHQAPPSLSYPEERLCLPCGEAGVELAAAEHYLQRWEQVYFVENSLINTLFGLALWDEIFLPLPGAFVNPFQSAPLDMHTRDFYVRRQQAIDARLEGLADSDIAAELLAIYDRHRGLSNHWINWRAVERQMLAAALETIPAQKLFAIWRRILFDPQANRSGFPDLLALDPGRAYCMIEVKGPGDQLQLNQKRWLRFFQSENIPCLVAWVDWQDE